MKNLDHSRSAWPNWYRDNPLNMVAVGRVLRAWFPVHLIGCLLLYLPLMFFEFRIGPPSSSSNAMIFVGFILSAILLVLCIFAFSFCFTIVVQIINSYTKCSIPPSVAGLLATAILPLPAIAIFSLELAFNGPNTSILPILFGFAVQIGMNTGVILTSWWQLSIPRLPSNTIRFSISKILIGLTFLSVLILLIANGLPFLIPIGEVLISWGAGYGFAAAIHFISLGRFGSRTELVKDSFSERSERSDD